MATTTLTVSEVCAEAKAASRVLASASTEQKNAALRQIADAVEARAADIIEANARDIQAGEQAEIRSSLVDRLRLTEERLAGIANDVRRVAELDDPVGAKLDRRTLYNGLDARKVRVPLGVVAIVYEARPNVTIDASALALKSGNAVVLRGSSMATASNAALAAVAREAIASAGLPEACVSLLGSGERDELAELATQDGVVDLIIPRGGEGLKNALKAVATVPVIYAASGNCHVYVDSSADLGMAREIVLNAKLHRPSVCNAAESLVVHEEVAAEFLPGTLAALHEAGVELRVDERTRALAGETAGSLVDASDEDFGAEFLDLVISVKVVDSLEDGIAHVNRYGSGHSEAIVTSSEAAAEAFTSEVDAACVYVNASTRFTDGGEFGMGAEMCNSTQKLHARGPVALEELCTYKWVVRGTGQVRA